MRRPHVICHMTLSVDGKVTGDFLSHPAAAPGIEEYYRINRELRGSGFACGRVTMEGSFTGGWYPDLTQYPAVIHDHGLKMDWLPDDMTGFYAVAFDPHGRLGWRSSCIVDEDPGYGGARIIEVLTEQADPRYLGYLESVGIPYIFAGEEEPDVELALFKLKELAGVETLLLEGGSILNGAFHRAGVIDELSLVVVPVSGEGEDKPLFDGGGMERYRLKHAEKLEGDSLWLRYSVTDQNQSEGEM